MLVLVEHFLTEEGSTYFPSWLTLAQNVLMEYNGFVSVEQLQCKKQKGRNILLLRFQSEKDLKVWAFSQDHKNVLDALKPYMTKKQESKLFNIL